jgi:hypothetical protein
MGSSGQPTVSTSCEIPLPIPNKSIRRFRKFKTNFPPRGKEDAHAVFKRICSVENTGPKICANLWINFPAKTTDDADCTDDGGANWTK